MFLLIFSMSAAGIMAAMVIRINMSLAEVILFWLLILSSVGFVFHKFILSHNLSSFHSIVLLITIFLSFVLMIYEKHQVKLIQNEINEKSKEDIDLFAEFTEVREANHLMKMECVSVSWYDHSGKSHMDCFKFLISVKKSELVVFPDIGDRIWLRGRLKAIENNRIPSSFDWKKFNENRNIYFEVRLKNSGAFRLVRAKDNTNIRYMSAKFRERAIASIGNFVDNEKVNTLLAGMLFGEKKDMDYNDKAVFSKSGVMHILSVSGLHIGIVYLILNQLLILFFPNGKKSFWYFTWMLSGIWFYSIVTGLVPSVNRSAFMFSLLVLAEVSGRKLSIYNSIFCSAFFILCVDPMKIFDLGFQLSYSAVLGIVSIYPFLDRLGHFDHFFLRKIWSLLSVSAAAQLGTLPFILYYFKSFPTYFLISNLIAVPATTLIIIMTISIWITSFLEFLHPLTTVIADTTQVLVLWLIDFLSWIAALPLSSLNLSISLTDLMVFYIVLTAAVVFIYSGKKSLFYINLILFLLYISGSNIYNLYRVKQEISYIYKDGENICIGQAGEKVHMVLPLFIAEGDTTTLKLKLNQLSQALLVAEPLISESNRTSTKNSSSGFFELNGKKVLFLENLSKERVMKISPVEQYDVILIKGDIHEEVLKTLLSEKSKVLAFGIYRNKLPVIQALCQKMSVSFSILSYKDFIEF